MVDTAVSPGKARPSEARVAPVPKLVELAQTLDWMNLSGPPKKVSFVNLV